jgi:hypothetical protein
VSPETPEGEDLTRAIGPEEGPREDGNDEDSWAPPSPELGAPAQLVAAVVLAFVAGVILVGAAAALSWLLGLR